MPCRCPSPAAGPVIGRFTPFATPGSLGLGLQKLLHAHESLSPRQRASKRAGCGHGSNFIQVISGKTIQITHDNVNRARKQREDRASWGGRACRTGQGTQEGHEGGRTEEGVSGLQTKSSAERPAQDGPLTWTPASMFGTGNLISRREAFRSRTRTRGQDDVLVETLPRDSQARGGEGAGETRAENKRRGQHSQQGHAAGQ